MRIHNKLAVSLLIAGIVLVISMYLTIIPCQTAAKVPNPQYSWAMCSLNPDSPQIGLESKFFSYTTSIRASYIILLVFTFSISYLIIFLLTKKKSK